jgi:exopolysaccharide production protein ExoZ
LHSLQRLACALAEQFGDWVGKVARDGSSPLNKINNIQALRAYAAIAVVIFHTGYIFPHMLQMGKFGVDIFFVISGFIMAKICDGDTRFFLRRRLIRILPPYWGMTILLFLFGLMFPRLLYATSPHFVELVKSLLFIPYYREDGLIRPLLYVGWSLNYEMLFYLLLSLGLLLFSRRPLFFAAVSLVSINWLCHFTPGLGAVAECYRSPLLYEFLFGVLAYQLSLQFSEAQARKARPVILVGGIAGTLGMIWLQGVAGESLPGGWLWMQIAATLMVLSAALLSRGGWDVSWPGVVIVGDASYVLYLTHAYILSVYDRILSRYLPGISMRHAIGAFPLMMLCVLTAVFLHRRLEKPAIAVLNKHFGANRGTRLQRLPRTMASGQPVPQGNGQIAMTQHEKMPAAVRP